jgi:cytochrome c5
MKKLLSVLFMSALVIIACSKKTVATKEVSTTKNISANPSIIPAPENPGSTPEVNDVSLIAAGKTIYETKCTRCHGMKPTVAYTADRWNGILKLMAPRARLTETETQQVTAFVRANSKN